MEIDSACPRAEIERTVEILQFTDLHLVPTPKNYLWDINPYSNFTAILEEANARYPCIDFLVLTGDLVHDPDAEAYRLLQNRLAEVDYPIFRLPGNHDDVKLMDEFLIGGNFRKEHALQLGSWQIILLDTNAPTATGGRLGATELAYLESSLRAYPNYYALICLHHHPVPINSSWMDAMALQNAQDFFGILDRYPQVRGVIWGHIHQEFNNERRGVRLLGSPATSVQFVPYCDHFEKDSLGPGFRWLGLHSDGQIETKVHYLGSFDE